MSASPNGSRPRCPRPVGPVRRHAALLVATGALTVGLAVLAAIGFDGASAAGQAAGPHLVDLSGPDDRPIVTDVLGERAAAALSTVGEVAAAQRAEIIAKARRGEPARADDPDVWDRLAWCEAGGNWASSIEGFSGGLGFAHGTWQAHGGDEFAPVAAEATREQQIEIARRVLASSGWRAWPGCSELLGLR